MNETLRADATLRTAVALRDTTRALAQALDHLNTASDHLPAADLPEHLDAGTSVQAAQGRLRLQLAYLDSLRKHILNVVDARATASAAEQIDALSRAAMVPAPNGEAA